MIYAIGVESKRHAIYTKGAPLGTEDFRLVEADADGWIPWQPSKRGSNCPLAKDAPVEVLLIRGHRHQGKASNFPWFDTEDGGTVELYRPILDAKTEPPMPEQGTDATTPRRPFLDSGRLRERLGPFEASPPAWNGEELPPVGCECEIQRGKGLNWSIITVRGYSANKSYVWVSDDGCKGDIYLVGYIKFRPIRSAEDKAVEEMEKVFREAESANLRGLMRALYRAGYRKTGGE